MSDDHYAFAQNYLHQNLPNTWSRSTRANVFYSVSKAFARVMKNQHKLTHPGNQTFLLRQIIADLRREPYDTTALSRLRSIAFFADALTVFPKFLYQYPTVRSALRAWDKELYTVTNEVRRLDQPFRTIVWEADDQRLRLTELTHPAHIAYQGLLHGNSLVNRVTLMQNRAQLERHLEGCILYAMEVKTKTVRLLSFDTANRPIATLMMLDDDMLYSAEIPYGHPLGPDHVAWPEMLAGLNYLVDTSVIRRIAFGYSNAALIRALANDSRVTVGIGVPPPRVVIDPNELPSPQYTPQQLT